MPKTIQAPETIELEHAVWRAEEGSVVLTEVGEGRGKNRTTYPITIQHAPSPVYPMDYDEYGKWSEKVEEDEVNPSYMFDVFSGQVELGTFSLRPDAKGDYELFWCASAIESLDMGQFESIVVDLIRKKVPVSVPVATTTTAVTPKKRSRK